MENFSDYNQNFSDEFTGKIGKVDKINLHLNLLFLELQDLYTATYMFKTVDTEWKKRVCPGYSVVRNVLYDALVYRVIVGLSKIFTKRKGEYSLTKAINKIEAEYGNNEFKKTIKNSSELKKTINEIRQKFSNSPMIPKIRAFRDKVVMLFRLRLMFRLTLRLM